MASITDASVDGMNPERRHRTNGNAQGGTRGPAPAQLPPTGDGSPAQPSTGPVTVVAPPSTRGLTGSAGSTAASGAFSTEAIAGGTPTPPPVNPTPRDDWRTRYVWSMRIADAVAIVLTLLLAQLGRFGADGVRGGSDLAWGGVNISYWFVGIVLGILWWSWLELRGTRAIRLIGYGMEESREVSSAVLIFFSAVAIFSFALSLPFARGYVLIALPTGLVLLILGRWCLRTYLLRGRRRNRSGMSRTMVVGRQRGALETVQSLQEHVEAGLAPVVAYYPAGKQPVPATLHSVDVRNALPQGDRPTVAGILEAAHRNRVQALVLTNNSPLSSAEIRHLSWYLADARIRLILNTGLTDIAGPRIHTQQLAGLPLIHVSTPRMSWSRRLLKRGMDVVGSLFALAILSPVMLVVGAMVKAHDSGPVFFGQERVGLDGSRFKMLKFRSMYTDAEERKAALLAANESQGDVLFKMKDDPRVTKPGKVLRRYSLDELPQFVNVLKGEMSLVGPRPPLESEVDKYEDYVHRRLRVKPGITGLWQVSGRSDLDWDQSVRLDLYYVENWSVLEDTLILLRTVKAVFAHDGAY
ncbi:sugar transferase [Kocuria sp.]|uniref:sugar transferase n=1 Tax=Kocuria sp. TaxID=1871328 RepID=UPI0026DF8FB8|nr:sugar transferase [Kocuria sp.]MDO5619064.1 sugar transferase [Kocuria sp.]